MSVVVIDYGAGNLKSVLNKFKKLGIAAKASEDPEDILKADRLVIPGVGHFGNGMQKLRERNLIEPLNQKVLHEKVPVLGICLGMQLFTDYSEEGDVTGLGWIKGKTVRFRTDEFEQVLKVPHMGWNSLSTRAESPLFENIPADKQFYFVHSYHVECEDRSQVLARSRYGYEFDCAVANENIIGTQFHPEKSHDYGQELIRNFVAL